MKESDMLGSLIIVAMLYFVIGAGIAIYCFVHRDPAEEGTSIGYWLGLALFWPLAFLPDQLISAVERKFNNIP